MGSIRVVWWRLVFIGVLFSVCCGSVEAQTWNEFFRQKRTQEKYLLQQLAQLKVYASSLNKGYRLVSGGLQTIKGLTSGELALHEAFFGSLALVSPVVKNHVKVAEVLSMQVGISRALGAIVAKDLEPGRLAWLGLVRDGVLEDCGRDLDELLLVLGAGGAEMGDSERLRRLNSVHAKMLDKYQLVMGLYRQVKGLEQAKSREFMGVKALGRWYE